MKVTFILQDLFAQGAQYVTALMIRGFMAKGYDVDLIVSKVHADLLAEETMRPFEIPDKARVMTLADRKARNNIREIRRYLRTTDSMAVIAMSENYNRALAIASAGLSARPLIAYVEHSGYTGLDVSTGREMSAPSRFSHSYLKSLLFMRRFDVIMAVSSGTAAAIERMNRLPAGTVKVVYNPVVDDVFYRKLSLPPAHSWLKDKSMPTFTAAGAHSRLKNHFVMLEAIKKANERQPVRLVLFGKGTLTPQYRKWIEANNMADRIALAGFSEQLPAEIRASDGFLISSDMESFSVVLVEAMAAGCPVISTACHYGPPELLDNGRYGCLVPVGDAGAMAEAICRQIENPAAAAPGEAWQRFCLPEIVGAYECALNLDGGRKI